MSWSAFQKILPDLDRLIANSSKFHYTEIPSKNIGKGINSHELYEGNNLDVLKFFRDQPDFPPFDYIFVDPPYNSHLDVILNDYRKDSPAIWNSGSSHVHWMEMLYFRLRICHDLLHSGRGVIQVCCDDKEMAHVRLILDLIFGEFNFIGTYIWKSMKGSKSNAIFTHNHTYIFTYAKDLKKYKKQKRIVGATPEIHESILDQFPDSIEARYSLQKPLESAISPDLIRFLNPKPLELLRYLLKSWAPYPDARILDLYSGTGSMLLASILENIENPLGGVNTSRQRCTVACQYPFSLSDFFRLQSVEDLKIYRHRTFIELTLHRLQYEYRANQWEKMSQVRFYRQILKPRKL
ncbi:MAG: DNA methyltransferase [Promethearchaeota archaeon]